MTAALTGFIVHRNHTDRQVLEVALRRLPPKIEAIEDGWVDLSLPQFGEYASGRTYRQALDELHCKVLARFDAENIINDNPAVIARVTGIWREMLETIANQLEGRRFQDHRQRCSNSFS